MRWILVFIFLYAIPLIILFRNNKNLRRACIYGSTYIVLATTIVISNMYMSGLNKIEEALYYQNYAFDQRYKNKYVSNFEKKTIPNSVTNDNEDKEEDKENKEIDTKNSVNDKSVNKFEEQIEENNYNYKITKSSKELDLEKIYEFKKDIYDIERVALVPMRECIPYTKDISKSLSKISQIREDIVYAEEMCKDVIDIYNNMSMPELSKEEYKVVLSNARDDVKKAYELRQKAMESAIKLLDTKNTKYIGKITEYLKLSDNHIASFKDRMNDLKEKINKE